MNRYGLPIAFAAALHSIILFGFNCRPSKATVVADIKIAGGCPLPLPPEEMEIIESSAEPSPPAPAEFEMPPLKIPDLCCLSLPPIESVPTITPPVLDAMFRVPGVMSNVLSQDPFGWGEIVSSTLLDRVPTPREQVAPDYPFSGRTSRLVGQVIVEFVVDERGNVAKARIVQSTAREFEEPSLRAVMRWKFEPGTRNNRVVPFRMAIPIVFGLND